jgi:hypothetical protein
MLHELRKARKITQVQLPKTLGVKQEEVSRFKQRADMHLSLNVEAFCRSDGRHYHSHCRVSNRAPVKLAGFGTSLPSAL